MQQTNIAPKIRNNNKEIRQKKLEIFYVLQESKRIIILYDIFYKS